MKAVGLFGRKYVNVERREYDLGEIGPNDALVEVKASGVCGTDLNFLRDSDDCFHPLGHELSGEVLEIGSCVRNVKPGDKVVIEDVAACGCCRDCQEGNISLCRSLIDGEGRPGMATHYKVNAHCLVPFDGISFEAASLTEPLAVGITATQESDIPFGGSVVVFGHGPIGLFVARCAKLRGAGFVAVVGMGTGTPFGDKRFGAARALGADLTIEGRKVGVADEVRKVLPNGADRVIVTAPPVVVPDAVNCCRFGGRVSVLGLSFGGHEVVPLNVNQIVFNKIDVKGVIAEPAMHFRQAIDLLKSKAVDPDVFITDYVTFDTFEQRMRDVLEQKIPAIKVCLRPNPTE